MDEEIIEKHKQAGKIAKECLIYGRDLIKPGAGMLEVTQKIEQKIKELGAKPAFPPQISCNEIAAHYCAFSEDPIIFEDQVCCLDIGVHVDGFIGDNALTVDLSGENADLVKASKEGLKAASEVLEVGMKISLIGKAIEDAITNLGFEPVRNLSGHGLAQYGIHTQPTIPNYDTQSSEILHEGFIAIEPFATNGSGWIHEKGEANVFEMMGKKSVRTGFVRNVQKEIESFENLPFTRRWLESKFSEAQLNYSLAQFKHLGIMQAYPPLVEKSNGLVSQAENSFYIGDEVIMLTQPWI